MPSVDGQVALVTGATGGIGKAIATALAREGATVAVVGRSTARAEEAMQDVMPEGLEMTFATNVMAYFLLTNLLLDALKRAASTGDGADASGFGPTDGNVNTSRVVNVASRYSNTKIDFDDLQTAKGKYSYLRSTPPTMLGRVLLTQEFAERLQGTGVVVNAVHPGLVKDTALLQDVCGPFRWITNKFGKPADKAVDTAVWLATAPEAAPVSGRVWFKGKEMPTPHGFGPGSPKAIPGRVYPPGQTRLSRAIPPLCQAVAVVSGSGHIHDCIPDVAEGFC